MFFRFIILCLTLLSVSIPLGGAAAVNAQVVAESEMKKVIEEFVRQRTSSLGVEVNIKKIGYIGDMNLPAGLVEYEVKAPQQWEGWGNVNLALYVRVDGQVKRNIPVRVEVEALAEMVVTTRQMEQGEVIGRADIALQKRDLATAGKICRSMSDVVGKRLRSGVRGNIPLRTDQLEMVPLVKSGQLVTIVLENDLMRVTATGRCRGGGAAGELITVQNMVSQKDIPARVVDASTVRVDF